jgi:hypothetical protein
MARDALRKVDPVRRYTGEQETDYEALSYELANRLIDTFSGESLFLADRKPSADEAAWVAYGTLTDMVADIQVYDAAICLEIGKRIADRWESCKIQIS